MKMFHVVFHWIIRGIIFVQLIDLNTELKPMWDLNPLCLLRDAAYNIFRSFLDQTVTAVTLNSVSFSYKCLRVLEPKSEEEFNNSNVTQNNMSRIFSLILLCICTFVQTKGEEAFWNVLWLLCQCKVLYTYFYRTISHKEENRNMLCF